MRVVMGRARRSVVREGGRRRVEGRGGRGGSARKWGGNDDGALSWVFSTTKTSRSVRRDLYESCE